MSLLKRKPLDQTGAAIAPEGDMACSAPAERSDASFLVDGVTCRAWVYEPDADTARPAPCIVMAHGLGGTRDASLEPYAKRFRDAGFYVVLFDYRYLGASDGEPRQLISPKRQLEDWRAAIAFARQLPGADPRRIGLWGTSLSGGHVLAAAARDQNIAAVSAQCPMLDGMASARMAMRRAGLIGTLRMAAAGLVDLARAALAMSPYYVPLAGRDGKLAAMASDAAYAGCMAIVPMDWCNAVAARIFLGLPLYRPLRRAKDVVCPTLLIACAHDSVVSPKAAADAAQRIGDMARLVLLPIDHFEIYRGTWFDRSSAEQLAFFRSALMGDNATVSVKLN